MSNNDSPSSSSIPKFIQQQLNHPPISPLENTSDFRSLFDDLAASNEPGEPSAADWTMAFQTTIVVFRLLSLQRMRAALISHKRPEAVLSLIRQTNPGGPFERGSLGDLSSSADRDKYFSSKEAKASFEARFAKAGYAPDAREVEAFQLALPALATLDRQIVAAEKQLAAFLKEIERRNLRRAQAFAAAVLRARQQRPETREAN
jgi:hypothetical protein